jgi:hypothetical protein
MKAIEKYAKPGEQCDVMTALSLLTKAYISQCGISLGIRTVVYCAAEPWVERLAWLDLPLSEMARKEPFVNLMPHITSDYDPEVYDKYDITGMDEKELLNVCELILQYKEFDDPTIEVLCWGILRATEEEEFLSQEIETTAPDETLLRGVLESQRCCWTWVTMTSPFDLSIAKHELVREPKKLLVDGYQDYQRLHQMESEIRASYSLYQEEIGKNENLSFRDERKAFVKAYGEILGDSVLVDPKKLFNEWFGLEFFDRDPHSKKRQ